MTHKSGRAFLGQRRRWKCTGQCTGQVEDESRTRRPEATVERPEATVERREDHEDGGGVGGLDGSVSDDCTHQH